MELPVDQEQLLRILRKRGVVFALVFGSRADGTARGDSDVDIAVWASGEVDEWGLRGELPDVVDVIDVRSAPEGLAGRIAMTGTVLLDDDPKLRIRWQADTRKRYLDEGLRRQQFRRDFVAAHGSHG